MSDGGTRLSKASVLVFLAATACSKSGDGPPETRPDPWASKADAPRVEPASAEKDSGAAGANPEPLAVAPASAAPSASVAPASDAGAATATKAGGATAEAAPTSGAAAASPRLEPSPHASAGHASAGALVPASARTAGKNFVLDMASAGCRAGEACAVTLRLQPQGDYHVNKEYPYKFIATKTAGITYLGSADPDTFTRAAGDYREEGEKSATMTVKFKPAARGEVTISGTYKLSVCSADNCQIEQQPVSFKVPVS